MSAPELDFDTPAAQREVRLRTLAWVERVVVGLDLCPFARGPVEAGRLRIAVCASRDPLELLAALDDELAALLDTPASERETSLLVHPRCLLDFEDYNDFLAEADGLIAARELEGVVQIASFHPDYRFADAPADDPANYSNRSPFPMLHLLREDSISRAVDGHVDIEGIPARNVSLLRGLSAAALAALLD
ncbi:DUF1415 domain-containing protein [Pseudenhygromyxa sp. WMMC2535]|uniref:DUF1415 domain-containing protein n=1 Tax=Pseudenhygromyxa sp. WMMC2535 TaxID=2712867 RepID=UPI00155407A6|nr:DUF1415 domain-containing protein [Pseudenhygromyxa sp. WMMC2535]NVB36959.1 DUF1415 domain-containing protein [Pseudenhygromyxa sp. WMMC2535]